MSVAKQYRSMNSQAVLSGLQTYVNEATTFKSKPGDLETWKAYEPTFKDLEAVWSVAISRVAAGDSAGDVGFQGLKDFVDKQRDALNSTIRVLKVTQSSLSSAGAA
jgi:hypothetical protein